MKLDVLVRRPKRIFYGWWVVVAGAIIAAMGGGVYFYGFTTFFLPLSKDFALTRTATSSVFAVARLEGGLEAPLAGWLIDRIGARKLLIFGLVLLGAGYIGLHWVNSFLMFAILYIGVISIGFNTGYGLAVFALANKWFIRQRSMATGIVSLAMGLGGAVIVPSLAWLIIQYGWQMAAVVVGATSLIVGLPLCLVIRNLPEDKGLLPDGDKAVVEQAGEPVESGGEVSFAVREALKTPAFWILSFALALRLFVVGGMWVHMIPLLVFKGLEEQAAANAIGLLLIVSLAPRFFFGWLGDIWPKRYLLMLGCFLETGAVVILLMAQSLWQVYLFTILMALGYGVAPLNIAIVGEYFGRKNFATIRGIVGLVSAIGIITGPIYAGYVYDVTQSYEIAFITFIVVYAAAGLTFFFARRSKPPARVRGYTTS